MLTALFSGPSLVDSCGNHSVAPAKHVAVGELVDLYRNLNRQHCFSIKSRQGPHRGLVTGYGRSIVVTKPQIVISEASRNRVVKQGVKNVHAFVRGQLQGVFDGDLVAVWQSRLLRVSYSPYVGNFFYRLERDCNGRCIASSIRQVEQSILDKATLAIVNGSDVFLDITAELSGGLDVG